MTTGVYIIANLENGNVYIGSSARCLRERLNRHRNELKAGKHHSRYLQAAWNKYGDDAFMFQPLEETAPEDAVRREQSYMDAWAPAYNIHPNARSALGVRHSDETKAKAKAIRSRPDVKARQSAASKAAHARPDVKERNRAGIVAAHARPEVKARYSAGVKAAFAKPDVQARHAAALKEAHARLDVKEGYLERIAVVNARKRKSVIGTCIRTGEVKRFESISEAGRQLGGSCNNITEMLKGRSKSAFGHTWKYET